MATQTFEELIAGANKIKDNELPESNTHNLVGNQLLQMTNKMQEENSNNGKKFSELESSTLNSVRYFVDSNFIYNGIFINITTSAVIDNTKKVVLKKLLNNHLESTPFKHIVRIDVDDIVYQYADMDGSITWNDIRTLKLTNDVDNNYILVTCNFGLFGRINYVEYDILLYQQNFSIDVNTVVNYPIKEINKKIDKIYQPLVYPTFNDYSDIDYYFLISIWTNVANIHKAKFTQLYNRDEVQFSQILTIVDDKNRKYIYRNNGGIKTGIEEVLLYDETDEAKSQFINITVDWDKIPTSKEGTNIYIKEYAIKYEPFYDLTTPAEKVFNVQLPKPFLNKLGKQDVLVVVQGDSLIGLQNSCTELANSAKTLPPGCGYNHFCKQLWDRVVINKPISYRYDNSDNFFTLESGDMSQINSNLEDSYFDTPNIFGEFSVSALCWQSQYKGTKIKFNWDLSGTNQRRNKGTIVFAKHPNGGNAKITVGDGSSTYDGIFVCSINRKDWVELNNYVFDCNSNRNNISQEESERIGHTWHMRNVRLWVKTVTDGDWNDFNVKYDIYIESIEDALYMYFWGVELWKGNTILFDFVGRGGRDVLMLRANLSDIVDRHPDLLLYSCPLANDMSREHKLRLVDIYEETFIDNQIDLSYKKASNDYQDWQIIAIIPHCRYEAWDGNEPIVFGSTSNSGVISYDMYQRIYNILSAGDIITLNLIDALISLAKNHYTTIQEAFDRGNLTADSIHLNDLLSSKWAKYIAQIFNA